MKYLEMKSTWLEYFPYLRIFKVSIIKFRHACTYFFEVRVYNQLDRLSRLGLPAKTGQTKFLFAFCLICLSIDFDNFLIASKFSL